mmetsp:Transcript_5481/g.20523  ORF Transcript_5481/g.20523 Transcript_5481/m.20523 type:complete len:206 (-) Transcript_5481:1396-2013(-)
MTPTSVTHSLLVSINSRHLRKRSGNLTWDLINTWCSRCFKSRWSHIPQTMCRTRWMSSPCWNAATRETPLNSITLLSSPDWGSLKRTVPSSSLPTTNSTRFHKNLSCSLRTTFVTCCTYATKMSRSSFRVVQLSLHKDLSNLDMSMSLPTLFLEVCSLCHMLHTILCCMPVSQSVSCTNSTKKCMHLSSEPSRATQMLSLNWFQK